MKPHMPPAPLLAEVHVLFECGDLVLVRQDLPPLVASRRAAAHNAATILNRSLRVSSSSSILGHGRVRSFLHTSKIFFLGLTIKTT